MPVATCFQFFLPRWFVVPLARLAGRLAFRLNRGQRERICVNLRHTLGPAASEGQVESAARRTFEHLAASYADMLRAPVLRKRVTGLADFDRTGLDQMMASGKGGVLVTGHIGNWDLAGVYLTALGYPLSAVVEPIPAGWTRTFNRYRCLTDMEAIPIPDRPAIARAIARRRLLTLVADRDLTGHGVPCPAFGAVRSFPRGPAAYALKYDLPVCIGFFVFQSKPGRPPYFGRVDPPLRFKPTGNTAADIETFTRLIANRLNEFIRQYPDQWLAFRAGWQ